MKAKRAHYTLNTFCSSVASQLVLVLLQTQGSEIQIVPVSVRGTYDESYDQIGQTLFAHDTKNLALTPPDKNVWRF
ncbi:hypothetical protein EB796_006890 [Bugula neritina]|uniref:Uncharacterized protein n=1 Tax=Bugula neritina TaxID=10212 RepID=A0A7J7K845_BUGNE|nr:hypothetical protein EB796_006890 [Bugula neritina]